MRAVMVMFDTLSRNFLPNYNNEWVHAPNFKRLQEKTVTFDQFYGGSMPCMPARRELHTGNYNFLHRQWGPLESFDGSVFEELQKKGVYTHLVTDHSHYFEDGGATYHNRYSTWEGFRGQEGDRWIARGEALPNENKHKMNKQGISVLQHFANRTRQQREEDMSSVQTIAAGLDFLSTHKEKDNWFLQIECFDPHEPFYVPEKYRQIYDCEDKKDIPYWPAYQQLSEGDYEDRDLEALQKEYAALISMCDYHLGKVLDFMDEHDMWKDTLLIVNTDHGFLLGEHNWVGKNIAPLYEEVIHIPFFIHIPNITVGGTRCSALSQTIDIPVTLMDYFNIPFDNTMVLGNSLLPILEKEKEENHDSILFGTHGSYVNIHDGRYTYMRASANEENGPLYNHTLAVTAMRGFLSQEAINEAELMPGTRFTNNSPYLKIPVKSFYNTYKSGNLLFDIENDPKQKNPIADSVLEREMSDKLVELMQKSDAPDEQYVRLGLEKHNK